MKSTLTDNIYYTNQEKGWASLTNPHASIDIILNQATCREVKSELTIDHQVIENLITMLRANFPKGS